MKKNNNKTTGSNNCTSKLYNRNDLKISDLNGVKFRITHGKHKIKCRIECQDAEPSAKPVIVHFRIFGMDFPLPYWDFEFSEMGLTTLESILGYISTTFIRTLNHIEAYTSDGKKALPLYESCV